MLKKLTLINLLFLAGCVTNPPIIDVKDRIVEIPVPVPCKIRPVDEPTLPVDKLKKEDALDTKLASALSEIERREAYEKELKAAIKECQ